MARVLAVANQKGGVGKTTTVHTLGVALAELGDRVLLVDLDPQACLTYSRRARPRAMPHLAARRARRARQGRRRDRRRGALHRAARAHRPRRLRGAPARHASGASTRSRARSSRCSDDFDIVLIDCPPSLGVLTVNGLTAADVVLIPLQCETLSHRGVGQLLETVADVRAYTSPDLSVRGVVATMFDGRTRHTPRGARRRRRRASALAGARAA